MTKVRVAGFSISLDGFGAGPDQSLENPLGRRGLELHQWFFGTRTFRANESRIHRSLDKDAPFHRAIEHVGIITSQPFLGGPHHQYCRI